MGNLCLLTSSQCKLCCWSHGVALIKDHQFHSSTHKLLCAAECLDLITHHIDTSIITSIQLQCHILVSLWPINLLGHCEHTRCLTSARWPIEQQMWHGFAVDEFANYQHIPMSISIKAKGANTYLSRRSQCVKWCLQALKVYISPQREDFYSAWSLSTWKLAFH